MKGLRKGWAKPGAAAKFHYFEDGRSLCGRWAFGGDLEEDDDKTSPGDCKACAKKLAKRRA